MYLRKTLLLTLVLAFVIPLGCRKPAKVVITKGQRLRIEENLLDKKPEPGIVLNATFGEHVRLIGLDLSKNQLKPGDPLTITWYWESLKELSGNWKVFGHLELPGGRRMILDHTPVGELYPISEWKPGEIIRDIQSIVIDSEAKPGQAILWTGVFNEEILKTQGRGDRLQLSNADAVRNDGDNRVRAVECRVIAKDTAVEDTTKEVKVTPPPLKAGFIYAPIHIDGKFDEPAWSKMPTTTPFVLYDGKTADKSRLTTVKALYDNKNLYFAFQVLDQDIENPVRKRDGEVWTGDAIEIYLDPNADGKNYVELQFSPGNVVFDALFHKHRTPDWKEASAFTMKGLQSAVTVHGTMNQPGDEDKGYDLEVAIPLKSLPDISLPVKQGDTMRINFFRIDAANGKVQAMYAFAPVGGDFHNLEEAGTLEFSEEPQDIAIKKLPPMLRKKTDHIKHIRRAPSSETRERLQKKLQETP